jgi:hypothetical protein
VLPVEIPVRVRRRIGGRVSSARDAGGQAGRENDERMNRRTDMRIALAACAATCSIATGDELITTFGNDVQYAKGWPTVAQTFVVPESNVLERFTFGAKHDVPTNYTAYLAKWDADLETWVGGYIWSEVGSVEGEQLQLYVHPDVEVLLPRGEEYIMLVSFWATPADVAVVLDDYDEGALVTRDPPNDPYVHSSYDMYFSATFSSCHADANGDGALDILDFIEFQSVFMQGAMEADCNNDGMLNVLDFVCFQSAFQEGCGVD